MAFASSAHSAVVARNTGSGPVSAATQRAWIDPFVPLRGVCAGDALRMAASTKNANAVSNVAPASNGGAVVVCVPVTAPTIGGKVAANASCTARSAAPSTGCQRARGVSSPSRKSPTRDGRFAHLPAAVSPRETMRRFLKGGGGGR